MSERNWVFQHDQHICHYYPSESDKIKRYTEKSLCGRRPESGSPIVLENPNTEYRCLVCDRKYAEMERK